MKKKLIASAVISAVAISAALPAGAANPNARVGLDNVLDEPSCAQVEDGVDAHWVDPDGDDFFEGDTKYGGDLEVDAELFYFCEEPEGTEPYGDSETAIVDVNLSQDESDPFWYVCEPGVEESAVCLAHIDWEDLANIVDEAAADRFGELADECTDAEGEFFTWGATLESVATFGVKEMNPGHGNGRQNYEKAFASCPIEPNTLE